MTQSLRVAEKIIQPFYSAIARQEWLGDAEQFPEIQTDLDGLKEALDRLVAQEKQFNGTVSGLENADETTLRHTATHKMKSEIQAISRSYSHIISAMNAISMNVLTRYHTQSAINDSQGSFLPERDPTSEELQQMRSKIQSITAGFDNSFDISQFAKKIRDTEGIESNPKPHLTPLHEWRKKFTSNVDPDALKDIAGFKAVAAESGWPREAKLYTLLKSVSTLCGLVEVGRIKADLWKKPLGIDQPDTHSL